MRKLIMSIILIFGIMTWASTTIVNSTGNRELFKINVTEVNHSIVNTPLYIAISKDYFKEEKLNISLMLKPWDSALIKTLIAGESKIGLCTPRISTYLYDVDTGNSLESFAKLSNNQEILFIAKKTYLTENYNYIKNFISAMNKSIDFINNNSSDIITDYIYMFFPDIDKNDLAKLIDEKKQQNIWNNHIRLLVKAL